MQMRQHSVDNWLRRQMWHRLMTRSWPTTEQRVGVGRRLGVDVGFVVTVRRGRL